MKKIVLAVFVLCLGLGSMVNAQQMSVDERIKPYAKVSGISGNASSIGSDTMNNLMALWLEGFRKFYPNVRIQIEERVEHGASCIDRGTRSLVQCLVR